MNTYIDCDTCQVRGTGCSDCFVTALLGPIPPAGLDEDHRQALTVLAEGGLVPPLRMVEPVDTPHVESA